MICSTVSLSLIPSFSLIINAPNAIRNDFAGAPISAENPAEYSDSNSVQGIKSAIITQRLSDDNFPSNGSSKLSAEIGVNSSFRYIVNNDTLCWESPL